MQSLPQNCKSTPQISLIGHFASLTTQTAYSEDSDQSVRMRELYLTLRWAYTSEGKFPHFAAYLTNR